MKINVLTQLRETIEDLIIRQTNLHKPFRNFIIETMILYITMLGKVNYTSIARISDSCESRFRQNFRQSFDWLKFNAQFTEQMRGSARQLLLTRATSARPGRRLRVWDTSGPAAPERPSGGLGYSASLLSMLTPMKPYTLKRFRQSSAPRSVALSQNI